MGHMDPATGRYVEDDEQDPATGMVGQQEQAAAAAPDIEIPPVPGPSATVGDPAIIGPDAAAAPGVDLPPDNAPELPGVAQVGEPAVIAANDAAEPGVDLGSNAPVTAEAPPAPATAEPAPAQSYGEKVDEIAAQKEKERAEQGKIEAEKAKVEAAHAAKVADAKAEYERQRAVAVREGESALSAARARTAAEYDRYRAMGEKDVWGDSPTASKVLAGLAILLGGRPAASFVTGAVNGLYEKKKDDLAKQLEVAKRSGTDEVEAQGDYNRKLADLDAQKAAGLDSFAARAEAEMSAKGVPMAQIKTNQDINAIRQAAADAKRKADRDAHADAEQAIKDKLANAKSEAEGRLTDARVKYLEAQAGKADRWHMKGSGGGGGGGKGGINDRAAQLAGIIQEGADDGAGGKRPLTPKEKMDAAIGLGIPITGKPSEISLKSVDSGIAPTGKDINASMNKFETQAVGTSRTLGPVRVLSQVEAMRKGLDEAVASGDPDKIKAAAVKAKEQAGTLMSGGKLTNAQITILHTLESTSDELRAKVGKLTGNPTEGKGLIKRLSQLIDDAGTETVSQIADIRQRAMDQHLGPGGAANTPAAKAEFLRRERGIFGTVSWKGKPVFKEGEDVDQRARGAAPVAPTAAPASKSDKAATAAAIVADQSHRSKYTASEWARLIQMSRGD